MRVWGIFCPGPSLKAVNGRVFSGIDHSIAVNGAVVCGFYFDSWVVLDIEALEVAARHRVCLKQTCPFSTLWFPAGLVNELEQHHKTASKLLGVIMRTRHLRLYSRKDIKLFNNPCPRIDHLLWRHFTMFIAIALAIRGGAKQIRVYGADLAGDRYFVPGLENERTRLNRERWEMEREIFNEIVLAAQNKGIKITQVL